MANIAQTNQQLHPPAVPPTSYYEPQRAPVGISYYEPEQSEAAHGPGIWGPLPHQVSNHQQSLSPPTAPHLQGSFTAPLSHNPPNMTPTPIGRSYYFLRNSTGLKTFIFFRSSLLMSMAFLFISACIKANTRGYSGLASYNLWPFLSLLLSIFGNFALVFIAFRLRVKTTQSLGKLIVSYWTLDFVAAAISGGGFGALVGNADHAWQQYYCFLVLAIHGVFLLTLDIGFTVWAHKKRKLVMDSEHAVVQAIRSIRTRDPVPVYG